MHRRTAVCTICAKNYLHFARTLMDSLRRAHPDWEQWVGLVDRVDSAFDASAEPFSIVESSALPLPDADRFRFRYDVLEMCTAIKPWLLEHLFSLGYERVLYLDPDIVVHRPLAEVERALDEGAFCVLTPHLTGPLDDASKPSEHDILRSGSYNLGFLALGGDSRARELLSWWQRKLEFACVVDFANNLFVDQRWMDLVPGMFAGVSILRHEGYNVAYWNLKHRLLEERDGEIAVNGVPLVFFHFSGLDPLAPERFSKHQNRYRLRELPVVPGLVEDYRGRLFANGFETCRRWPYTYGAFGDQVPVPAFARRFALRHAGSEDSAGIPGDPFVSHEWLHAPWGPARATPRIPVAARALWETRSDLQWAFPDPTGADRVRLAQWLGEAEGLGLPSCCTRSGRRPAPSEARSPVLGGPGWRRKWKRVLPPRVRQFVRDVVAPQGETPLPARPFRALRLLVPPSVRLRVRRIVAPAGAPSGKIRRAPWPVPVLVAGFLPAEPEANGSGRWMGASAWVRIAVPREGELRIRGEYAPEPHRLAGGADRTTLAVALGGREQGRIVLERPGPFDETLRIEGPFPASGSTLELSASQVFVPADIGEGEDGRRRSVRIASVSLDGKALLDFVGKRGAPAPDSPAGRVPSPEGAVAIGINVVGYLRSELGVGESARVAAEIADAGGVPCALVDFREGCLSRAGDDRLAHRLGTGNPHPVNVFHVNADQMQLALETLGEAFFADRYNVGFWHWELPDFPDEWCESFALVHEIWTPSEFVTRAIARKSPVPVLTMPHAIGFRTGAGREARPRFSLPERDFLFLAMFDAHSLQGRKNPEAVIEAFHRAFPDPRGVGLVLKVMNTATYPAEWEALQERLGAVGGVHVIDRTFDRSEVWDLESACDAFVSLHRSEGFGLGLAECMALGKPVIATNWSGNVDFMNERNSCPVDYRLVRLERDHGPYRKGQVWADADPEHAARYMRKLVSDGELAREIGLRGRETIRNDFSPEAIGALYRARLDVIARHMSV